MSFVVRYYFTINCKTVNLEFSFLDGNLWVQTLWHPIRDPHPAPKDYEHCSSVLNSPNNKKSVSGKFQPLFVTGGCKLMGQWFFINYEAG